MATAWLETGEGSHCAFLIHKEVLFIQYQLALLLVELHSIKRAMYMYLTVLLILCISSEYIVSNAQLDPFLHLNDYLPRRRLMQLTVLVIVCISSDLRSFQCQHPSFLKILLITYFAQV